MRPSDRWKTSDPNAPGGAKWLRTVLALGLVIVVGNATLRDRTEPQLVQFQPATLPAKLQFRGLLPAKARKKTTTHQTPIGPSTVHQWSYQDGFRAYTMAVEIGPAEVDPALLEQAYVDIAAGFKDRYTVSGGTRLQIGGHPAYEVRLACKGSSGHTWTGRMRLVAAERYLFTWFILSSQAGKAQHPDREERFIKAFQLPIELCRR